MGQQRSKSRHRERRCDCLLYSNLRNLPDDLDVVWDISCIIKFCRSERLYQSSGTSHASCRCVTRESFTRESPRYLSAYSFSVIPCYTISTRKPEMTHIIYRFLDSREGSASQKEKPVHSLLHSNPWPFIVSGTELRSSWPSAPCSNKLNEVPDESRV